MVLMGLAGMRFDTDGVRFQPCVPPGISWLELRNVQYRRMHLDVTIRGTGTQVHSCLINGQESTDAFLAATYTGPQQVTITLGD